MCTAEAESSILKIKNIKNVNSCNRELVALLANRHIQCRYAQHRHVRAQIFAKMGYEFFANTFLLTNSQP